LSALLNTVEIPVNSVYRILTMANQEIEIADNHNYYVQMAGEFYVLAQLFARGFMAALTYGNAKSLDIFVAAKSGRVFKLEVKTAGKDKTQGSDKSQFGENYEWKNMAKKHESKKDKDLYYCFVMLRKLEELPRFFIVKSETVAKYVRWEHKYYLNIKRSNKVQDTTMRTFRIGTRPKSRGLKPIEDFENRWDILPQ